MLEKLQGIFFTTKGRLNRLTYFKYSVCLSVVLFLVAFVVLFFATIISGSEDGFLVKAFQAIISFAGFIAYLTLAVRRLHDLDKKEFFVVLTLIPVINFFFALYLLFFPGTQGTNRYGEQPL